MSAEERFVFDTNVLVSALLFAQGKPARAFRTAQQRGEILVSVPALEELDEVLRRRRLDRYLTAEEREDFLRALIAEATLVEPDIVVEACRDPKDNKFLELAVSGNARYLITGDQDLLVLNPYRDVAVVTPHQFLVLTDEQV